MEIGVSSACLYPMITENSLEILLKQGFKNFEIFVNSFSEIEKPYITTIKNMLDEYGAKVVSIHPFTCLLEPLMFFSDYERRTIDGIELYKKYFDMMNYFGTETFIFHGQVRTLPIHKISNEEYFEGYHRLYKTGKSFGIDVAQENIRNCRNAKIDFIKQMKSYLKDDVAFTFDIKQSDMEGEDPFEMMRAMGDKIRQVHISDKNETTPCTLPGYGNRDFPKIIHELKTLGYDKTIMIEVYSNCFINPNEIYNSTNVLKNLI